MRFWEVLGGLGTFGTFWEVLGGLGGVLGRLGTFWAVLGCFEMF